MSDSAGKRKPTPLAYAWMAAAHDLRFEFISPFEFAGNDGNSYTCSGLIPSVGTPKGTLIISGCAVGFDGLRDVAEGLGNFREVHPALGSHGSATEREIQFNKSIL
jgi:hypothetical protein